MYSYRRGLRRCSFNCVGQCEGLRTWDEQQGDPTLSVLIYACFYGISEVSKKGINMSTLEQAKKHLQDVINQEVDATVCPLDDAKIHAAIVDYMLAALSEGDDGVANEKCGDELTKLFEGKLGEAALTSFVARIDSVYDTVRTICYLSDKGDGPLGWNDLNN